MQKANKTQSEKRLYNALGVENRTGLHLVAFNEGKCRPVPNFHKKTICLIVISVIAAVALFAIPFIIKFIKKE